MPAAAALLDPDRSDDARTAGRLTTEPIIWLGTTRPDGRPHQVPVWFAWRDPEIVMFSQPGTRKLTNLARTPAVALHLEGAANGTDIVLAEGAAAEADEGRVAELAGVFAAKYAPVLGTDGFEAWRRTFTRPLLITVTRVVAWTRVDGELTYRSVP